MQLTTYNVIYLITNVLYTYTLYLFFQVFFNKESKNKKLEFLSYAFYFIVVSTVYLFITIPLFIIIANLIAYIVITLNYKVKINKKVMSIFLIYSIMVAIEVLVAFLFRNVSVSIYEESTSNATILEHISVKMVAFIIVLFVRNYQNLKKENTIPMIYWVGIFIIPLGILYIIILLLQLNEINQYQSISIVAVLLLINVMVFYLYDQLNLMAVKESEKALLKQQNNYYNQQFELMQESTQEVRTIKHDLKNHLFVIQSYIKMDNDEKAIKYISKISEDMEQYHQYVHSGNIVIDSILNFKLAQAEEKDIEISADVLIPNDLEITPFSMTVILGNLLDNAISATEKLDDNGKIDINIKYNKKMLIISIDNTFDGNIVYEKGQIVTTKKDKENHGLGLQSIKRMVEQHHGELNINYTENVFLVTILIYV